MVLYRGKVRKKVQLLVFPNNLKRKLCLVATDALKPSSGDT